MQCSWITPFGQCSRFGPIWPRSASVGIPLCWQHRFTEPSPTEPLDPVVADANRPKPDDPQVYLIRNPLTSLIKIGRSVDPQRRVRTLSSQVGVDLELIAHQRETPLVNERLLHHRFREHRVRGEWFSPTSEILGSLPSEP